MATNLTPGTTLGRGDLNLFIVDSLNNPANAAEITYALYYYDTSGMTPVEVLIGNPARIPINPQIGEYYAAIQIPPLAVPGEYHLRWSFRQYVSSAVQQVVQVFNVVTTGTTIGAVGYTAQVQQFINKLRLHLRDQCLGGEEEVELDVAGEKMIVRLDELWEAVQDEAVDNKLRLAFKEGTLKTPAVSPEGKIEWKRVLEVFRNEVPWETIYEGTTAKGSFVLTAGHRIFCNPDGSNKLTMEEVAASGTGTCLLAASAPGDTPFNPGFGIFAWDEPSLGYLMLHGVRQLEPRQFMFDLTTEDWHNFILVQSRVIVTNSPDRHYHFRPPEHDGDIGQFNKVFGQIWEDHELYEYLVSALDTWNTLPPFTGGMMTNLDQLLIDRPSWRSAILWSAISWACFALMATWTADEFSLSYRVLTRIHLPDGKVVDFPIGDLWHICKAGDWEIDHAEQAICEAFQAGSLKVEAVDPVTCQTGLYVVLDVLKHHSPHKRMLRIETEDGRIGEFTADHSLFTLGSKGELIPMKTSDLVAGESKVAVVLDDGSLGGGSLGEVTVAVVRDIPAEEFTYDLSVPGPENFRLTNGVLAHNSYSIGGISLDIEKASKYQTMKDSADAQFEKMADAKVRTLKWARGLSQPRFGIGCRSAFGPVPGRGILGPRSFV